LFQLIGHFCAWLQSLPFALAVRQSTWLFPTIETIHVLSIVLVVGSIGMFDLRLLNIASRDRTVADLYKEIMPWTWTSFVCAAVAGFLLFSSDAVKYSHNVPFRIKMILLLLIGTNTAFFQFTTFRDVATWGAGGRTPFPAKFAAALSLVSWVGVVACGRWIGFTK
jgi:hypothetical protein